MQFGGKNAKPKHAYVITALVSKSPNALTNRSTDWHVAMKDARAQPFQVVSKEIFHQPCISVRSNGTSNLVYTDRTWSVETDGTLTSEPRQL